MISSLPPVNKNKPRVRVLIVDDTPQVRRDLHQFLELGGDMEIVGEASDGQEAVQLAAQLSPDVIIMDLEMPGMDGFEATRLIKAQIYAPRVVILSMHAGSENVTRARSAGADAFVAKGDSFQVLIDAILGLNSSSNSNHL